MLVGDLRASGLDHDHMHVWPSREGIMGLTPLPGSEFFQFQAVVGPEEDREPSLAWFQELLERRGGRGDLRLSDPRWMSLWRENVRLVEHYRAGRALVAGDAAHVHSPGGGQGMNTGMQDAYNLGWKLGAVLGGAGDGLLNTYGEERRPLAAGVLGLSSGLSRRVVEDKTLPSRFDDATLQLSIHYRGSGLSRELRANPGTVQAGDRAPDAPGLLLDGTGRRLFDLLRGPQWTALAFGDGWDGCLAGLTARYGDALHVFSIRSADTLPAPGLVIDRDGFAAGGYDLRADTLLLIRPDGYLGLATEGRSPGPVLEYLRPLLPVARFGVAAGEPA